MIADEPILPVAPSVRAPPAAVSVMKMNFFVAASIGANSERRPYMRAAYSLFKGDSTESELAKQMDIASGKNDARAGAAYFYANLYLGLYAEAKGDDVLSRKCERATPGRGGGGGNAHFSR